MRTLGLFDVDGTILDGDILREDTIAAIRQFRKNGNLAVIFSGRPVTHIDRRVKDIGFDGYICTMGAYVEIDGKTVKDIKPEPKTVSAVIEAVKGLQMDAVYESDRGAAFAFKGGVPGFLEGMKKHFAEMGLDTEMNPESEGFTFDKLCVWKKDGETFDGTDRALKEYLDCAGKKGNMEEWTAKGIVPAESVGLVKEHFGIPKECCIAIGDSITDWPFLSQAGMTIAMGQGHQQLKDRADYVTGSISEGGFAEALRHFDFIK